MTTAALRAPQLASGAALAAGIGLVAAVDPHRGGPYPPCIWHAVTGTWCPGCGGLRATYDLAHGHLAAAAGENVLVVIAAAVALVAVPALWWRRRAPDAGASGAALAARDQRRLVVVLSCVALVFTVLRNLPVGAVLAP
jgi:hypothetical protein